jgi:hypothetical protein
MLAPSCLHTLYMICNVTMTSLFYIQVIWVNIEAPPQVNIKLGFPYGCEAPTQAHKAHHQTHKSPTQIQGGFHQTESVMWFPRRFPHSKQLGSCENTCPKLQKSTLPLSEEGILNTLHQWECLSLLPNRQHSLLSREAFHPPSSSRSSSVSRTGSSTIFSLQSV